MVRGEKKKHKQKRMRQMKVEERANDGIDGQYVDKSDNDKGTSKNFYHKCKVNKSKKNELQTKTPPSSV